MGRLIYLTLTSLDGFIGDGDYSWSAPNEEAMAALTAGLAEVGTYLYGRRTYETMAVWETDPAAAGQSPESAAFATTWQAADKVVFSSTLAQVHTRRTRLERQLAVTAVRSVGQYPQARRVRAGFGRRVVDTSEHARTAERRPRVIAASIGPDSVRLLSLRARRCTECAAGDARYCVTLCSPAVVHRRHAQSCVPGGCPYRATRAASHPCQGGEGARPRRARQPRRPFDRPSTPAELISVRRVRPAAIGQTPSSRYWPWISQKHASVQQRRLTNVCSTRPVSAVAGVKIEIRVPVALTG